jgi:hypothetical protein
MNCTLLASRACKPQQELYVQLAVLYLHCVVWSKGGRRKYLTQMGAMEWPVCVQSVKSRQRCEDLVYCFLNVPTFCALLSRNSQRLLQEITHPAYLR